MQQGTWLVSCTEELKQRFWVEVKDSEDVFLEGYFVSQADKVHVKLYPGGKHIEVSRKKLYQKNNLKQTEFDDMVNMPVLNEPEILSNIRRRYAAQNIYTRIGSSLIIVNPFQVIEAFQIQVASNDTTPHIGSLTATVLRDLVTSGRNQAIVLSGESGAGKTENTKQAMNILARLSMPEGPRRISLHSSQEVCDILEGLQSSPLEDQVLACNPILEAFGNARTPKNDNTSRFGKFVKIYFHDSKIAGASVQNYLLEKSRLCTQQEGDRNFHAFYQMLLGAPTETLNDLLMDSTESRPSLIQNFRYLVGGHKQPNHLPEQHQLDEERYCILQLALEKLDIGAGINRLLGGILWLGNIEFTEHEGAACTFVDPRPFENVIALLGFPAQLLQNTLLIKQRTIQKQIINSPMSAVDCCTTRDALAKWLYDTLFDFLVHQINHRLQPSHTSLNSIGLLDIFGFENMGHNSFEQLCINYTNEKLHQIFLSSIFKLELDLYQRQRLTEVVGDIQFVDNQGLIDQVEKGPHGIFHILDDHCKLSRSSDEQFAIQVCRQHPQMASKFNKANFLVQHTAGLVEYCSEGFREKNLDNTNAQVIELLQTSQVQLVSQLFALRNNQAKQSQTLSYKFRAELKELTDELGSCDVHFIRCIKPNELNARDTFNSRYVMAQIRYLGLLENVRIKRVGHGYKLTLVQFIDKYACSNQPSRDIGLSQLKKKEPHEIIKHLEENLLAQYQGERSDYVFGVDMIFFKEPLYDWLEGQLKDFRMDQVHKANKIGKHYRKWRRRVGTRQRAIAMNRMLGVVVKVVVLMRRRLRHQRRTACRNEAMLRFEACLQGLQKRSFFRSMHHQCVLSRLIKAFNLRIQARWLKHWNELAKQIRNQVEVHQVEIVQEPVLEPQQEIIPIQEQPEPQDNPIPIEEPAIQDPFQEPAIQEPVIQDPRAEEEEEQKIDFNLIDPQVPDEPKVEPIQQPATKPHQSQPIGPIEFVAQCNFAAIAVHNTKILASSVYYLSSDGFIFEKLDESFFGTLWDYDWELGFAQLIPIKSKWGRAIRLRDYFMHSSKALTESLTAIKSKVYMRSEASQPPIKMDKSTEKTLHQLVSHCEESALEINNLILKYGGDRKTSKNLIDMAITIISLITQRNTDPLFRPRRRQAISQWQFVLIDETYLQIVKQIIECPDDKAIRYLRLMSILASYVPVGPKLFYPLLNLLLKRRQVSENADVQRGLKFVFGRLLRENLKFFDTATRFPGFDYDRLDRCFLRQYLPLHSEIGFIALRASIQLVVYLLNGAILEIRVEASTTIKQAIAQCLHQLGVQSQQSSFGMVEFLRQELDGSYERHLDGSERILDVTTKLIELDIYRPKRIYLNLLFFEETEDPALLAMQYIQSYAQIMTGRLRYRGEDYLNLAVLKLCIEKATGDYLDEVALYQYGPLLLSERRQQSPISATSLASALKERLRKLQGTSPQMATIAYIEYLKQHPLFFAVNFDAVNVTEYKLQQPSIRERLSVSFSPEYIYFCVPDTRQVKRKISREKITKWTNNESEFTFVDESGTKITLESDQAEFMAYIFARR